jgi:hypothetical protein
VKEGGGIVTRERDHALFVVFVSRLTEEVYSLALFVDRPNMTLSHVFVHFELDTLVVEVDDGHDVGRHAAVVREGDKVVHYFALPGAPGDVDFFFLQLEVADLGVVHVKYANGRMLVLAVTLEVVLLVGSVVGTEGHRVLIR